MISIIISAIISWIIVFGLGMIIARKMPESGWDFLQKHSYKLEVIRFCTITYILATWIYPKINLIIFNLGEIQFSLSWILFTFVFIANDLHWFYALSEKLLSYFLED